MSAADPTVTMAVATVVVAVVEDQAMESSTPMDGTRMQHPLDLMKLGERARIRGCVSISLRRIWYVVHQYYSSLFPFVSFVIFVTITSHVAHSILCSFI